MDEKPAPNLRKIYGDICRGHSIGVWWDQPVYIKHLSTFEYAEAETYENAELERALKRGIPSKEEKREWLKQTGQWTDGDERDLKQREDYIKNLRVTRSKMAIPSQAERIEKTIDEETAKYNEQFAKREKLFDLTAERVASQKVQFFYVYLSFYRDAALTIRLFTMEDINALDDEDSMALLVYYIDQIADFGLDNIRRIAIAPFFLSHFSLCGEQVGQFFQLPLWKLTMHQANLLSSGLYFRNITRGEDIPDDISDDPEKIEDFVKQTAAKKEMLSRVGKEGGATGLAGATAADFKKMGLRDDRSFLRDGETSLLSTLKPIVPG